MRVSGNQIVALNGWHLPGLKLRSKLREGTRLWLEPATDEERDAMREELMGRCKKVLDALNRHRFAHIFAKPVDPAALNIPDYPEVIPNPMDLGTVGRKLERGEYAHFRDFQADCELTFQNCVRYNPAGTDARTPWETRCSRSWRRSGSSSGFAETSRVGKRRVRRLTKTRRAR